MQIYYWTRKFFKEIRESGEIIASDKEMFKNAVLAKVKMKLSLYENEIEAVMQCFNDLYYTNIKNA